METNEKEITLERTVNVNISPAEKEESLKLIIDTQFEMIQTLQKELDKFWGLNHIKHFQTKKQHVEDYKPKEADENRG